MNASLKSFVALLSTRKTIVIILAALLLVAASGWANTRGSPPVAVGNGHYNLQPIW
jgi:hypothetical protein